MLRKIPYSLLIVGSLGLALFSRCRPSSKPTTSDLEHYFENNQLWALGQVTLGDIAQMPDIFIKTVSPSRSPTLPGTGGSAPQKASTDQTLGDYQLSGQIGGESKDVAFVDYHPTETKLLSYIYRLEVLGSGTGQWTVYARLFKTPKMAKRAMIVLGTIGAMPSDQPQKLQLAMNINRSMIVDGPMLGFWALHIPDVAKTVVQPWLGICPRNEVVQTAQGPLVVGQTSTTQTGQMPGQTVGQNPLQGPGQGNVCRSLAVELDLCGGDPMATGCLPPIDRLLQKKSDNGDDGDLQTKVEIIKGATPIGDSSQSYVIDKSVEYAQFAITFPKVSVKTEMENNDLCNSGLLTVQKTVGGLANPTCSVTVIPSSPRLSKVAATGGNGGLPVLQMLRCALQVQFTNPRTYLERVCQLGLELRPARAPLGGSGQLNPAEIKSQIDENLKEWVAFQVVVRP